MIAFSTGMTRGILGEDRISTFHSFVTILDGRDSFMVRKCEQRRSFTSTAVLAVITTSFCRYQWADR